MMIVILMFRCDKEIMFYLVVFKIVYFLMILKDCILLEVLYFECFCLEYFIIFWIEKLYGIVEKLWVKSWVVLGRNVFIRYVS